MPESWCLPEDYDDFIKSGNDYNTYIMKPNNNSCARGITLLKNKRIAKNFTGVEIY